MHAFEGDCIQPRIGADCSGNPDLDPGMPLPAILEYARDILTDMRAGCKKKGDGGDLAGTQAGCLPEALRDVWRGDIEEAGDDWHPVEPLFAARIM